MVQGSACPGRPRVGCRRRWWLTASPSLRGPAGAGRGLHAVHTLRRGRALGALELTWSLRLPQRAFSMDDRIAWSARDDPRGAEAGQGAWTSGTAWPRRQGDDKEGG